MSCADGGLFIRKPRAVYAATSCSSRRHRTVYVRSAGTARTRAFSTRRTVGLPTGNTGWNAVGVRLPPPLPGMQPACGLNVTAGAPEPTYVATKTTERDVVRPGATGLPIAPKN